MNVLLISTQFPPRTGGIGISVLRLARALIQRGHRVLVVTRDHQDLSCPGLGSERRREEFGLDVITYPDRWFKRQAYGLCLPSLQAYAASFRPDVLHAYYAYPAGYLAISCGRRLGAPVVVSCRGDDITKGVVDRANTLRTCLEHADSTTFVAESLLTWASMVCTPTQPRVVPNSIGTEFADSVPERPSAKQQFGVAPDALTIGANALFRWKKGPEYLFELLGLIADSSLPNICFLLIGDFDDEIRRRVEAVTTATQSKQRLRTLKVFPKPAREELPSLLASLDLFLLTSIREGMPNSILEAMACGTCVAATAINGSKEVLSDPALGIQLDPYCPRKAHEVLQPLLEDRSQLHEYGAKGREHVQRKFSLSMEVGEYERVYASVQQ